MLALTAITAVLAIAVVLDWRQTLLLAERFWMPGTSISATELVNVPGDIVVGRGEPLRSKPPSRAGRSTAPSCSCTKSKGRCERFRWSPVGKIAVEFSHRVRAVDAPFAYRFRAGDGQTAWYHVDVAERPEIDKLQLTVTPPAYTGQKPKRFDKLPRRLSALEHSELELALRPDRPVETVALVLGPDKSVQLTAGDDGWYRWKTKLCAGLSLAPLLTESHGLTNRRARSARSPFIPTSRRW